MCLARCKGFQSRQHAQPSRWPRSSLQVPARRVKHERHFKRNAGTNICEATTLKGHMLRTPTVAGPFALACPTCHAELDGARCPNCNVSYACEGGFWRFLPPERAAHFQQFEREYLTVRRAEGWGSTDSAYYRALPFVDRSGRFTELWRIRAASFRTLLRELPRQPRRVLDLGAGNGWLSYQLALRGHAVAAVDVQLDEQDGLTAFTQYDAQFTPIQAEFDHLPLAPGQADVIVYNGSLHYSTDCVQTLREALRVLEPRGTIAILDSPMYVTADSGTQMVLEREARFQRTYGFTSDSLPSEHFLTPRRLAELSDSLGIQWRVRDPWHGWRRALLPLWARLRGTRQPARFPVIIGQPI